MLIWCLQVFFFRARAVKSHHSQKLSQVWIHCIRSLNSFSIHLHVRGWSIKSSQELAVDFFSKSKSSVNSFMLKFMRSQLQTVYKKTISGYGPYTCIRITVVIMFYSLLNSSITSEKYQLRESGICHRCSVGPHHEATMAKHSLNWSRCRWHPEHIQGQLA